MNKISHETHITQHRPFSLFVTKLANGAQKVSENPLGLHSWYL